MNQPAFSGTRCFLPVLIGLTVFTFQSISGEAATLDEALDAPALTWTAGGSVPWSGQTLMTHDGVDAAASGAITHSQESWFETTVTGPGTLSFWWKVSSEAGADKLRLYRNGIEQTNISGEADWQMQRLSFPAGSQTFRWRYQKDLGDTFPVSQDKAWVDQVVFGPPLTLADALDNPGLAWAGSGAVPWVAQFPASHDAEDAAASGAITHNQTSILQTTVIGPGALNFWWKVSSESGYDKLRIDVDAHASNVISGEVNWTPVSLKLPAGTHILQWVYQKDISDDLPVGQDKGWVDQVSLIALSQVVSNSFVGGANPQFTLQIAGSPGASYTVQASTNLLNWSALANFISTNSLMPFVDSNVTNYETRFYRVASP